jgi:hypothetical protein
MTCSARSFESLRSSARRRASSALVCPRLRVPLIGWVAILVPWRSRNSSGEFDRIWNEVVNAAHRPAVLVAGHVAFEPCRAGRLAVLARAACVELVEQSPARFVHGRPALARDQVVSVVAVVVDQ